MKNTKIVELIIEESNEALAIDAISLVSAPAIEQDFVFFGKEKHNLTFAKVDEEKRMLVSPALIPNKQIFRYDPQKDQEYYVYFSPETVRRASELYLKHNNHHKATYEHQDRVSGVLTTESWIIEDSKKDKSTLYGFDLPKGTWMVKMKIENDELWQEIKSGNLKGLSIEGYFIDKMQEMSKVEPTDEEILTALNEIIKESKTELKAEKVEFNLGDDLEKLADKFRKLANEETASTKKIFNVESELSEIAKGMEDTVQKGISIYSKLEKSAKELGVNVNKIPSVEKAARLLAGADIVKRIKSNLSKLNGIK